MTKAKPQAVKTNKIAEFLKNGPMRWYDWAILLAIFAISFFCFSMRDLFHTVGCSFGYLNGHIFDFYDYLAEAGIDENGMQGLFAAYFPTIYVIFAIWNIPMRIFGFGAVPSAGVATIPLLWSKLLPCLVFIASAVLLFFIAKELGFGERKSKLAFYAYLAMPVAIYVQFVMGQYEVFTTFFMLLGFYYWLKKKPFRFVLFFAIALTLKPTAILFFLPLLLLGEKNFWKILLQTAGVASLLVLETLIYLPSPAFKAHVFGIGGGESSPVNAVFQAFFDTGFTLSDAKYPVYLVILAIGLVLAWSYFTNPKNDSEKHRFALFFLPLSFAAMFCFTKWHPQWFMLVIPFWTLGAFSTRHTKIWLMLELLFTALLFIFNAHYFGLVLGENMLDRGVLKYLMPYRVTSGAVTMAELLPFPSPAICLSLITALIAIFAIFKHPKFQYENPETTEEKTVGYVRGRTWIGMLFFLVPAFICFFTTVAQPKAHYFEFTRTSEVRLSEGDVLQEFTATGSKVSKIKFYKTFAEGEEGAVVEVRLLEKDPAGEYALHGENYKVLYETTYDALEHHDNQQVVLKPGVEVTPGKTYALSFTRADEESDVALLYSTEPGSELPAKADGKTTDYHLSLYIFE